MIKRWFESGKEMFLSREFITFLVIGVFNTFNGSFFSYAYSLLGFNANLSFVLGYITSLIIAYFLNTFFSFRQKPSFQKLIRFVISYIPNFIIQNMVVLVVYNLLQWHRLVAYLLAAAIGVPITFLLLKLFAFRKPK